MYSRCVIRVFGQSAGQGLLMNRQRLDEAWDATLNRAGRVERAHEMRVLKQTYNKQ
jgi:hypothetical protein